MDRSPVRRPRELTPGEIDDAQDLRSVIVTALSTTPGGVGRRSAPAAREASMPMPRIVSNR